MSAPRLRTYHLPDGQRFKACGPMCADSFKDDRRHDLIYGAVDVDGAIYDWDEGSWRAGFCAYCGRTNAELRALGDRDQERQELGGEA